MGLLIRLVFAGCLASLVLAGCSRTPQKPNRNLLPELQAKVSLYRGMQQERLDTLGWALPKCDSLLFTSLCKVAGGCQKANILMARDEAGAWHRNWQRDCWQTGGSASTISKDMLMGLAYYAAFGSEKQTGCQVARQILDYGSSHNWVMGQPASQIGRVLMTPTLIQVYADIEQSLCPDGQRLLSVQPSSVDDILDSVLVRRGFEAHLQVLRITLVAELKGGATALDLEVLRRLAERESENALFQAAYHKFHDGIQTTSERLLLDAARFPTDHLPDSNNYCTHYLWQRDMDEGGQANPDWLPCSEGLWDGIDFLFAAWMAGY